MKKIVFFVLLILTASFTIALDDFDLSEFEGTELPNFAKGLFGNERVNLEITLDDDTTLMRGIVTEDGVLRDVTAETLTGPTVNAYTSEETIMEILNSDNPLEEFEKALDDGRITYSAVGVGKKVKFAVASLLVKFVSWFT